MAVENIEDLSTDEVGDLLDDLAPGEIEEIKNELLLRPFQSKEELKIWAYLFLGIDFPLGVVHPESTHAPADAMWRIYNLMQTGDNNQVPQIAMLSSRDSYKTLSAAALEVICMIHFRIPIAHMAAIKPQSAKAIQYVNAFFRQIGPYLENHGWKKTSDNKSYIEWVTDKNETVYLNIVTATLAGANSEHVPMLFIDEVDVVQDPRALKEAKFIPSMHKGYYPLTVYLSTRKFAGGLMEKTLKEVQNAGGEVLRWNILDITERITHKEAQTDQPRVTRYVSRELPMEKLTPEQFEQVANEHKHEYEKIEAYAGIADHPLLPVMKNMLVDRPQDNTGDLYKPVVAVYNSFKGSEPEMSEAQLLCRKPSTSGLVYPRFDSDKNVLTVNEALCELLGEETDLNSFEYLKDYIKNLGVKIIGGGDWGWTDYTALVILALLPSGRVWLLDSVVEQHLEIDDIVKYGRQLQEEWNVDKWYVDQNYPAYLVKLRKPPRDDDKGGAGWKIPKFDKVVADGITALQSKIVDSNNIRRFYILDTPNNQFVINAFGEYRWSTDGKGEVIEGKPFHDKEGVADVMDAIRYPAQNTFMKGKDIYTSEAGTQKPQKKQDKKQENQKEIQSVNQDIMKSKINELTNGQSDTSNPQVKKKGRIFWT